MKVFPLREELGHSPRLEFQNVHQRGLGVLLLRG